MTCEVYLVKVPRVLTRYLSFVHPHFQITMYWTIGSIYGATAVAFGAFGAHGLKKKIADSAKIASWNTAAHYQVYRHAAALKKEFPNN